MARPIDTNLPAYQQHYINTAQGDSIAEIIANHSAALHQFITAIPDDKATYSYAPNKWTVKQLLQHVIDTDRILAYRALCISRKETVSLPGFDEDSYAANATAAHRTLDSLKEEFAATRKSTDLLLSSFTTEQLQQTGTANGNPITVNAICYILIGHAVHHQNILKQFYLV